MGIHPARGCGIVILTNNVVLGFNHIIIYNNQMYEECILEMKKLLFVMSFCVSVGVFASSVDSYFNANINYAQYLHKARNDYNEINIILDRTAVSISLKGDKAFGEIENFNSKEKKGNGIFVIDPATGKLLVSPPVEAIGVGALKNSEINGKALAGEAIKEALSKLTDSPWERWAGFVGGLYKEYFTRIAITENGKVYVVAIGKTNINLQHLFIEKLVDKACILLTKNGLADAKTDFNKPNGIFNFKDTYIFVYQVISNNNLTGVYNPNYPEDIDRNVLKSKPLISDPFRAMLKLQDSSTGGWVDSASKPVGEDKLVKKSIYVKFVKSDGKEYMVGSGVYLD